MDTAIQVPLFPTSRATLRFPRLEGGPMAPSQLWSLLTPGQQQAALQALIQISLEIVEPARPEARDEHS